MYYFKKVLFLMVEFFIKKMVDWQRCVFLLPNATELLKTTTERIKTITEHLKVTTENIFCITIRQFLISCWETKCYDKTSKNGRRTLLFLSQCAHFHRTNLDRRTLLTATDWLDFYAEKQPFRKSVLLKV